MCAVAQNFKVMEIDIDDVTWKDEIVTAPRSSRMATWCCRRARLGRRHNEEFVLAHPPKR
jgi:hypothetical protein